MEHSSEPSYVRVARDLSTSIRCGTFPVGSALPTEAELCQAFAVSRFTVREALRLVQAEGLITRRQGSASRVATRVTPTRYVAAVSSPGDILRYADETTFEITRSRLAPVARMRLRELGPQVDTSVPWVRFEGLRRAAHGAPIGVVEVFVLAQYAEILRGVRSQQGAIFPLLAATYGFSVGTIDQEVAAVPMPSRAAAILGCQEGDPALRVVRRYADEVGNVFEVSIGIHPGADRFSSSLRFEREPARPGG